MDTEANQGTADRSVFGPGLTTADRNARKVHEAFRNDTFGKLRLTEFYRVDKRVLWRCECSCGGVRYVHIAHLKIGHSTSCGCSRYDADNLRLAADAATKHGLCDSPTWRSFQSMHQRCLNPKAAHFENYGGRGIKIDDRWLRNLDAFVASMGIRPAGTTLDRKDGDGPYSPENCRWATKHQQSQNRRSVRSLTYGDRTMSVAEWERELGMRKGTLHQRLKLGWSVEKALTKEVRWDGKTRD